MKDSKNYRNSENYKNSNIELIMQYHLDLQNGLPRGKSKARTTLINQNQNLIYHLLKRINKTNYTYDYDDLVSQANIGLINAIDTYNPTKNVNFSTYASRVILNELHMHFRNKNLFRQDISLDDDNFGPENNLAPLEFFEDLEQSQQLDDIANEDDIKLILSYINRFSTKKQTIFCYYYGLLGNEKLKQRQISEKMGISQSNVSFIIDDMSQKINKYLTGFKDENEEIYGFIPEVFNFLYPNIEPNKNHIRELDYEIKDYKNFKYFTEMEQSIFCTYYGLLQLRRKSIIEISKEYDVSEDEIYQITDYMKAIIKLMESNPKTLSVDEKAICNGIKRQTYPLIPKISHSAYANKNSKEQKTHS